MSILLVALPVQCSMGWHLSLGVYSYHCLAYAWLSKKQRRGYLTSPRLCSVVENMCSYSQSSHLPRIFSLPWQRRHLHTTLCLHSSLETSWLRRLKSGAHPLFSTPSWARSITAIARRMLHRRGSRNPTIVTLVLWCAIILIRLFLTTTIITLNKLVVRTINS